MTRLILTIVLFLSISPGFLCEAANYMAPRNKASKSIMAQRTVKIGSFTKIEAETAIKVNFTQGPATGQALISAQEDMIDYIKVNVKNEVLHISLHRTDNRSYQGPFTVSVQAPVLKSVELSAACSFVKQGN